MLFFETSAKTGQVCLIGSPKNVSVVFESVAQCILEQLKAHRHETRRDERVDLVAPASTESCCR